MKPWLALTFALLPATLGWTAPLRLHNRLVFTRGDWLKRNEMVWTMNADGGDQRRVWRVPEGYGQFGGFSNDGENALSFDHSDVYVHDLQTKRIHHLLVWSGGFGSYIDQPSFSPDGEQILCEVGDSNQNASNSWVLRLQVGKTYSVVNGLGAQELHAVGTGVPAENLWSGPRWSGDGKRIIGVGGPRYSFNSYYSRTSDDPHSEIWTMNSDGMGAHQLTTTGTWNIEPSWSHDGSKIVFVRRLKTSFSDMGVYSSNLVILDVTDRSAKALTSLPERFDDLEGNRLPPVISRPLFSSDGNQIAFEEKTTSGDAIGVYRIGADGMHQQRLSDGQLVQWVP